MTMQPAVVRGLALRIALAAVVVLLIEVVLPAALTAQIGL
jgi:hypothetical protein